VKKKIEDKFDSCVQGVSEEMLVSYTGVSKFDMGTTSIQVPLPHRNTIIMPLKVISFNLLLSVHLFFSLFVKLADLSFIGCVGLACVRVGFPNMSPKLSMSG